MVQTLSLVDVLRGMLCHEETCVLPFHGTPRKTPSTRPCCIAPPAAKLDTTHNPRSSKPIVYTPPIQLKQCDNTLPQLSFRPQLVFYFLRTLQRNINHKKIPTSQPEKETSAGWLQRSNTVAGNAPAASCPAHSSGLTHKSTPLANEFHLGKVALPESCLPKAPKHGRSKQDSSTNWSSPGSELGLGSPPNRKNNLPFAQVH